MWAAERELCYCVCTDQFQIKIRRGVRLNFDPTIQQNVLNHISQVSDVMREVSRFVSNVSFPTLLLTKTLTMFVKSGLGDLSLRAYLT